MSTTVDRKYLRAVKIGSQKEAIELYKLMGIQGVGNSKEIENLKLGNNNIDMDKTSENIQTVKLSNSTDAMFVLS